MIVPRPPQATHRAWRSRTPCYQPRTRASPRELCTLADPGAAKTGRRPRHSARRRRVRRRPPSARARPPRCHRRRPAMLLPRHWGRSGPRVAVSPPARRSTDGGQLGRKSRHLSSPPAPPPPSDPPATRVRRVEGGPRLHGERLQPGWWVVGRRLEAAARRPGRARTAFSTPGLGARRHPPAATLWAWGRHPASATRRPCPPPVPSTMRWRREGGLDRRARTQRSVEAAGRATRTRLQTPTPSGGLNLQSRPCAWTRRRTRGRPG